MLAKSNMETFYSLHHHFELEKSKSYSTVLETYLKHLYSITDEGQKEEYKQMVEEQLPDRVNHITDIDQYSIFNMVAHYRRLKDKMDRLDENVSEFKEALQDSIDELKEIQEELENHPRIAKRYEEQIHSVRMLLGEAKHTKVEDFYTDILNALFTVQHPTITKDQFLSIVNVDHRDKEVMNYIHNMPSQIDYDEFVNAVFVERVEEDYLFVDMIIDCILNNKEARERLREGTQQFCREMGIKTYNVDFDKYGEVEAVNQNRNIALVSDDE